MASAARTDAKVNLLLMRRGLNRTILGGGIALVAVALSVLFSGIFDEMEQGVQGVKYRLRGESPFDSSVVILYFDNPAIAKLGGLPLKRNFYALLIDALHDAGAKAIGVDIGLSDPDNEHPEYDQVLSSVLRKSGNVVLSGYFQSLSRDTAGNTASSNDPHLDRFSFDECRLLAPRRGKQLQLPAPELLS